MTHSAVDLRPLSARLRAETKDAHLRAERAGIMRAVLRGTIDRAGYVSLLASLVPICDALESSLDRQADDPLLAPFVPGALRRLPSLRADLAALGGTHATPAPEAVAYAAHLRSLGAHAPVRLVAHAYVRYLGDLSGGQILRGLVDRALSLGGGGTAFYDFSAAGEPTALKARFREALDALPESVGDELVREANDAFARHERLFEALADSR